MDDINGDMWLIKTNPEGDIIWTRTYGEDGGEDAWSVVQTPDGGFILAGNTSSYSIPRMQFVRVYFESNLTNKSVIDVVVDGNNIKVTFHKPVRAIASGQSIVLYDNDVCLGGGEII